MQPNRIKFVYYKGELINTEDLKLQWEDENSKHVLREGNLDDFAQYMETNPALDEETREDCYQSGYIIGSKEGKTEAYDNGYDDGYLDGIKDGKDEGYSKGRTEGYNDGYARGYAKAHDDYREPDDGNDCLGYE